MLLYRRLSVLIAPAQRTVQLLGMHKLLYVHNAGITTQLKISRTQPYRAIRRIQFLRTFAGGPLRAEFRQHAADLVTIDTVAAFIRATVGSILDTAARNSVSDNICQIADTVVRLRLAAMEDL